MSYEKLNTGPSLTNPKENAGLCSLLIFAWLNDLLKRGSQRALENDDLPPLLEEDENQGLTKNLEKEWSRNCKSEHASKTWIRSAKLWGAFWNLVPTSEKALVLTLASTHIILRLLQPLFLIGLLAELMKESSADRGWIYLSALGVCLCTWLIAISTCHCDYRSSMIGMRVRSALLGVIYKKVMLDGCCGIFKAGILVELSLSLVIGFCSSSIRVTFSILDFQSPILPLVLPFVALETEDVLAVPVLILYIFCSITVGPTDFVA